MPSINQADTPRRGPSLGCQNVVAYRGWVRGGGVGNCCVGMDFVNYPNCVTRKMGKISKNYPKYDTREMGKKYSNYPKRV
jgi:hypothetical protein